MGQASYNSAMNEILAQAAQLLGEAELSFVEGVRTEGATG